MFLFAQEGLLARGAEGLGGSGLFFLEDDLGDENLALHHGEEAGAEQRLHLVEETLRFRAARERDPSSEVVAIPSRCLGAGLESGDVGVLGEGSGVATQSLDRGHQSRQVCRIHEFLPFPNLATATRDTLGIPSLLVSSG